ncbi:hypothetical protein BABINDRAFT_7815 [Babjeviella inositovora NRRL Y-12698]|uniref:Zn(2)-C6 fungal-type domain-containing protein n=1 Tax=Babjeviella inositovora NRRL Y-12698 TaxID=984486 RepID=A0A1E3QRU0_9ASCO|nr:uncharacterized protein BABINDRAFT_7815 [Babjeviella inositovora NRRL Y-12698]ODQ80380.1 hypothetical protein BABINDRAFT_7815 [Babjeviella inositovora NRRL Y-12698]
MNNMMAKKIHSPTQYKPILPQIPIQLPSPIASFPSDSPSPFVSAKSRAKPGPARNDAGAYQLKSCTRCRQHKTKCNALQRAPLPCLACLKKHVACELDERAPPQRSNAMKSLKSEITNLQRGIRVLENQNLAMERMLRGSDEERQTKRVKHSRVANRSGYINSFASPHAWDVSPKRLSTSAHSISSVTSVPNSDNFPQPPSRGLFCNQAHDCAQDGLPHRKIPTPPITNLPEPIVLQETYLNYETYQLYDTSLSRAQVSRYFFIFQTQFLPLFPIINPQKTYLQIHHESPLLFWSIMLVACTSDADPERYIRLSPLVKQLVIENCWYATPRSSFIVQALLLLTTWPMPSHKLLDDVSYRLIGMSKNISMQLGLHRGPFINEFSRGIKGKDVKYRSKTWKGCFINEVCYSSLLGLPSGASEWDYIIDNEGYKEHFKKSLKETGDLDGSKESVESSKVLTVLEPSGEGFEKEKKSSMSLAEEGHQGPVEDPTVLGVFDCTFYFNSILEISKHTFKFTNCLGNSITNSGLINYNERFLNISSFRGVLAALEKRLLPHPGVTYYLQPATPLWEKYVYLQMKYAHLQLYTFAFFPNTSQADQKVYIDRAVQTCLDVAQVVLHIFSGSKMHILMYPIHFRSLVSLTCFVLARVQMFPLLASNMLAPVLSTLRDLYDVLNYSKDTVYHKWRLVDSDSSRTVRVLKSFELAMFVNPKLIVTRPFMISRMKSHLNASLSYEIIWFIHEIRKTHSASDRDSGATSPRAVSQPEFKHPIVDERIETAHIANEKESLLGMYDNDMETFFREYCRLDKNDPIDQRLILHFTGPKALLGASGSSSGDTSGKETPVNGVTSALEAEGLVTLLQGVQWMAERENCVLDNFGLSGEDFT